MDNTFTAYDLALSYAHAFRLLLNKHIESRLTGNYQDFSLIIPLMSIGGFACELFLKSLITEKCKTHKIFDLYKELDKSTAEKIKINVIQCMMLKKGRPDYTDLEFIADFKRHDKLFEEFRYFYETTNCKVYYIDFTEVLIATLQTLCEAKFGKRPINQ